MADSQKTLRLAAVLGIVAALLALSAVAVEYVADRTVNWSVGAAGLLIAALAFSAWSRSAPGSDAGR